MAVSMISKTTARCLAVCVLTVLVPVSAIPQTLTSISQLKPGSRIFNYLYDREHFIELYKVGVYWDRELDLQQGCKTQYKVLPIRLILIEAVDLPEDKTHPISGIWQHRFEFERCGEKKIYNAIFFSKSGEKPEVKPWFPGSTRASTILLSDALELAYLAASVELTAEYGIRDCKDLRLIDTRVTEAPRTVTVGDKVLSGVWDELWTYKGCGQVVEVALVFTPDGKGGAYFSTKSLSNRDR